MLIPAHSESTIHSYSFDQNDTAKLCAWITSNTLQIHAVGLHDYLDQRGRLEIEKYSGRKVPLEFETGISTGKRLFPSSPVHSKSGKTKYLECEWDNSDSNQPLVNGAKRKSRDVVWGSKSADEMYIGLFYITE